MISSFNTETELETETETEIQIHTLQEISAPIASPIFLFIYQICHVIKQRWDINYDQSDYLKIADCLTLIDWKEKNIFRDTLKGILAKNNEIWTHFHFIFESVLKLYFQEELVQAIKNPSKADFFTLRQLTNSIMQRDGPKHLSQGSSRKAGSLKINKKITGSGTRRTLKGLSAKKSSSSYNCLGSFKKLHIRDEFMNFLSIESHSLRQLIWRSFEKYLSRLLEQDKSYEKKVVSLFTQFMKESFKQENFSQESLLVASESLEIGFITNFDPYYPLDQKQLYRFQKKIVKYCLSIVEKLEKKQITMNEASQILYQWKMSMVSIAESIKILTQKRTQFQKYSKSFLEKQSVISLPPPNKKQQDNIEMARKFGQIFASRALLRLKRERKGYLDYRKLFRDSLKFGEAPQKIYYKRRNLLKKPNLVLLLDVSGSMLTYLPFLMSFFQELNFLYNQIKTYVFVDSPVDVSRYFQIPSKTKTYEEIFSDIINIPAVHRFAYSDYNMCFHSFTRIAQSTFNSRTVFIIVGDARNNRNMAAINQFLEISSRSKTTVWINPELHTKWNTGDSIINIYEPYCDYLLNIASADDLQLLFKRELVDINQRNRSFFSPVSTN